MQSCPFKPRAVERMPMTDRLLRRERAELARCAIENRLAASWPNLPPWEELRAIGADYHVSAGSSIVMMQSLYKTAYEMFLADGLLSASEQSLLSGLVASLNLSFDSVESVHKSIGGARYEAALRRILSAGEPDELARASMMDAADALGLSQVIAVEIFGRVVREYLQTAYGQMVEGHRVSPDAFARLARIATALKVDLTFDDATQTMLHRYAALWRVDSGELPVVDVPIPLQRGEVGHFMGGAVWLEHRKTAAVYGRAGVSVSVRIMRGVRFQYGIHQPTPMAERLSVIDHGVLFITNRRLVFSGSTRNTTVKIDALIAVHAFADGIALEKGTGKHPHFKLPGDAEMACSILSLLMNTE
jgi:uncharacterized protein YbjQ (UPF0145 family)